MPSDGAALRVRDVARTYASGSGAVAALADITFDVERGTLCVLSGPSGSGKSTLLRLLACLDRPDAGAIEIGGVDVARLSARARRRVRQSKIGYVFQQPVHNLLPYLTAAEHLRMAARLRGVDPDAAEMLLRQVGLDHRSQHRPGRLSGGEQQRLAVAIAVAGGPDIVVADEPTAELDRASAGPLIDDFRALRSTGSTLVVASHDPDVVAAADRVVHLAYGRVVDVAGSRR